MKVNSAILISLSVLFLGFFLKQLYLWIPLSVLIAGFISVHTNNWVASDRLGRSVKLSVLLKFFFALIGFYAMLGQLACIGLILWWFIF